MDFPGFASGFLSHFQTCSPLFSVVFVSLVPSTVAVLPQSLKRQAQGRVSKATNPRVSAFSPMTCRMAKRFLGTSSGNHHLFFRMGRYQLLFHGRENRLFLDRNIMGTIRNCFCFMGIAKFWKCGLGKTLQNLRSMAPMASEVQLLCFHFLQETSSTLQSILSPAGQNDRKRVLRQICNLSN